MTNKAIRRITDCKSKPEDANITANINVTASVDINLSGNPEDEGKVLLDTLRTAVIACSSVIEADVLEYDPNRRLKKSRDLVEKAIETEIGEELKEISTEREVIANKYKEQGLDGEDLNKAIITDDNHKKSIMAENELFNRRIVFNMPAKIYINPKNVDRQAGIIAVAYRGLVYNTRVNSSLEMLEDQKIISH